MTELPIDENTPRILIVEDEPKLGQLLIDYLRAASYAPTLINHGDKVLPYVRQTPPDLILLDLMLPGTDGLTLCREIRRFSDIPIVMVTAKIEEIDRLLGLEIGADDYICKPYSPREVVARVKTILRRCKPQRELQQQDAESPLMIDESRFQASWCGRDVYKRQLKTCAVNWNRWMPNSHLYARSTGWDIAGKRMRVAWYNDYWHNNNKVVRRYFPPTLFWRN